MIQTVDYSAISILSGVVRFVRVRSKAEKKLNFLPSAVFVKVNPISLIGSCEGNLMANLYPKCVYEDIKSLISRLILS